MLVIDQSEYIEDRPVPGPFPDFPMTKREKPWERGCIQPQALRRISSPRSMNVIPFPPHANLVAHGMHVCRLGSGGKSSKFKMALSKKQLLLAGAPVPRTSIGFGSHFSWIVDLGSKIDSHKIEY